MAHIQINEAQFATLKDKVVVLTGGANGIGRAAVKLFHSHGAKIIFGDINTTLGLELEAELSSSSSTTTSSPSAKFIPTDVTSYTSQLSLFKTAISLHGRVDIVVANAGMSIPRDPFKFNDLDSNGEGEGDEEIEKPFPTTEIDVNLTGCLFTARIGMFYLRKNKKTHTKIPAQHQNDHQDEHQKQNNGVGVGVGVGVSEGGNAGDRGGDIILVSSIAGFKESTNLAVYTASKHGVLGLLRGVRIQAAREGVRVNAVCPWMTKTAMVAGIESGWRALNLPENEPSDVAKAILVCATANRCLPPPIPSSCTSTTSINTSTSTNAHTLTIAHTNGTPNPNKENGISKPEGHGGATHPFTGKILFVAGGASYEIEERMTGLEGEWLGQGNSKDLERGQEFLMREGTSWEV